MSNQTTKNLALPLVQPAQAQKHVTVNDSLMRLDGLVNPVLESASLNAPPANVIDGLAYGVPPGAVNAWQGHEGQIAIASNGGWVFASPRKGQSAYVADRGGRAVYDGAHWRSGALSLGALGSGLQAGLVEGDVVMSAGTEVITDVMVPGGVMVIGASARVKDEITGTATAWKLGTPGALDRFGQGLGLAASSWARGMLSQPMTYWTSEALIVTAEGGDFSGGRISLAVHYLTIALPD